MTPFSRTPGSAALLAIILTPLAGCTTGRQFSIAMTNPGSAQTVLVVGEGDPQGSVVAASSAPTATVTALSTGQAAGLVGVTAQASALRSQTPTVLALVAPTTTAGASSLTATNVQATVGGVSLAPTPVLQLGAPSTPVQVGVTIGPSSASSNAQIVLATLSTPAATSSGSVTAGASGLALQASTPVIQAAVTATPAAQTVQATVSPPIIASTTSAAASAGGVALQASTSAASATVAAGPTQGLQVAVTSPASTLVAGTVSSGAAALQATLASVQSAVTLSAPSPASSTPVATALKTLSGAATKKLKHG